MGSFANSMHIKCDDANKVVAAISDALSREGYEATDEEPSEDGMMLGMPSQLRAMHVAEAHGGWVAVLDSDLMGAFSLASDLSKHLETHALLVMVNDSDSWMYQLYSDGSPVDEFDSSGGGSGECCDVQMPTDFTAEMLQDLEQRVGDFHAQRDVQMPADIRAIEQRGSCCRNSCLYSRPSRAAT